MGTGRARIAASILDADLGNLANAVRRVVAAGSDRIHLDIMDGHFVPNITFGPRTVRALRPRATVPFDAHLMISEPSRYVDEFIEAGCDSITFHVEVDEPIEPTLAKIRAAGRAAGLSVRPRTPISALEPYADLLDIVLVMAVEPGFGGQPFMADVLEAKAGPARELLRRKLYGGEIHVDGGINRETAEFAGTQGADVLVVGSALFLPGRDMGREVRLIRALADEGFQFGPNQGEPPIPRDRLAQVASLPKHLAHRLMDEIEATGIPVIMLRGDGHINPDGVRDYELLVPAEVEKHVIEKHGASRDLLLAEADAWRASFATKA